MIGFLKAIPPFSGYREKFIWFICCILALAIGVWFGYAVSSYLEDPGAFPQLKQGSIVPLFWGTAAVGFSFSGLLGIYLGLLRLGQTNLTYRGYVASTRYSAEDGCYVGHIDGIRDIVGFHAASVAGLESAFETAVDDYLETCAKVRQLPG